MGTPPVLLTRASGHNKALAAILVSAGHDVLIRPAIEIRPFQLKPSDVARLLSAKAIAFVSPNAVRSFFTHLELPKHLCSVVFAIGPGTEAALKKVGILTKESAIPSTATGLATLLRKRLSPNTAIALIVGNHSRPELEEGLIENGQVPMALQVYKNEAPAKLHIPKQELHAVVFFSPSAARNMIRANSWLCDIPAVAIGPTTAGVLKNEFKHQRVFQAQTPTLEHISHTLQHLEIS